MTKYTKRQISEAIKHWENVLRQLDESNEDIYVMSEASIGRKTYGPYGEYLKQIIQTKQKWWNPLELDDVVQFLGYKDADDFKERNSNEHITLKDLLILAHQKEKAEYEENQKKEKFVKSFNTSSGNASVRAGKIRKDDQYFIPEKDALKILEAYRPFLAGKKILCNCDDPRESQTFKTFVNNFQHLGLESVTAIGMPPGYETGQQAYMQTIDKNGLSELIPVSNGGDFQTGESQQLLKECDVVVSNPPFSNKLFLKFMLNALNAKKDIIAIGPLFGAGYVGLQSYIITGKLFVVKSPFQKFNRPDNKSDEQVELDIMTGKKDNINAPVALFSTFKNDAFGTPIEFSNKTTDELPLVYIDDYSSYFPIAAENGKFTIVMSIPRKVTVGDKTDPDNYNYILCPLSIFRKQWFDIFEVESFPSKVVFNGKQLFRPVLMHYKH